jgi:hypothetical protein
MRNFSWKKQVVCWFGAMAVLTTIAGSANALEAYRDRRGFFGGFGLGGGAVFQGGETGGGGVLDFQLGAGATKNLTVCLDVDTWIQAMGYDVKLMVTPGPEVNYYFGDTGLFIRGGAGAAITMIWPDDPVEDFKLLVGLDLNLGFGWEFFFTGKSAMGLVMEGDYVLLSGDDIGMLSFSMFFRFY